MKGLFAFLLATVAVVSALMFPNSAVEARILRGVCVRGEFDLGAVRAENIPSLRFECLKKFGPGTRLRSDIIEEQPCSVDDQYVGCEVGRPSGMTCSRTPLPGDAYKGSTIVLQQYSVGRSCVSVPKDERVTKSWCTLYDYPRSYTTTLMRRMTVAEIGEVRVYCWTVYNDANRERDFTLYVK
jgi:hypothetical protein